MQPKLLTSFATVEGVFATVDGVFAAGYFATVSWWLCLLTPVLQN